MAEKPKRTPEEEAALDLKIAEIRQRNKEIEERRKVVENEAKQYVAPKPVTPKTASVKPQDSVKASHDLQPSARPKARRHPQPKWDREWDSGKQPSSSWKMNVPEYGDEGRRPFQNAYAPNRTRKPNGSHVGRAGNASRLESNVGHMKRAAAGGRRQQEQLRNPAFFHDDRFKNGESKRDDSSVIDSANLPAAIRGKKIASRVTMRPSSSTASNEQRALPASSTASEVNAGNGARRANPQLRHQPRKPNEANGMRAKNGGDGQDVKELGRKRGQHQAQNALQKEDDNDTGIKTKVSTGAGLHHKRNPNALRRHGMPHRYGTSGRKFLRDDREIQSIVRGLVDQVCAAMAAQSDDVDEGTEDQKSNLKATVNTNDESTKDEFNAETLPN